MARETVGEESVEIDRAFWENDCSSTSREGICASLKCKSKKRKGRPHLKWLD